MFSLIRFAVVLCFAVMFAVAGQQWVQAKDSPTNLPIEGVEFVEAKMENGALILKKLTYQVSFKLIDKEVVKDGQTVVVSSYVEERKPAIDTREYDLKKVKVTDVDNKPIPADKLKEQMKELTPVVVSFTPITSKYRNLFKDNTVFIEIPPPVLLDPSQSPMLYPRPKAASEKP